MSRRANWLVLLLCGCAAGHTALAAATFGWETNATSVAQCLAALDTWILAPPKAVQVSPGVTLDLRQCRGITWSGSGPGQAELAQSATNLLTGAGGRSLRLLSNHSSKYAVALEWLRDRHQFSRTTQLDAGLFDRLGDQGYLLEISADGIRLSARATPGMRHALMTLAQIASDRQLLPGLTLCDWPTLKYRGVQQDISRGQVPAPAALERLAETLALAKMNLLELYIEHEYHFQAFPEISPPEGLTPAEAKALTLQAARRGVEVHPLLQTLGHSYHTLKLPKYQHLRVGPCTNAPWIMTFDIRKPEAVRMVTTMIDELCESFPGDLFNVDITEIDIDGLQADGVTVSQATDLVYGYVLKLHEALKRHGRRLMIAQGPLDSQGHLAGMGPKLEALPKDLIIGSYYCAGGPYKPAWSKDFPRLRDHHIDFFAQAWIYSHVWLTPWINPAAEFSDQEVARAAEFGGIGSITTDWGDAGHFHFVGEEWLPFLYHGACAWSGAQLDRSYFRRAFTRQLYGLPGDAVLRAIETASDLNAKPIKVRDKDGKESEIATTYIWEFVHDPFNHPDLTRIVDPGKVGQQIVDRVSPSFATLAAETPRATRNRDNLEQWRFGVRCYLALGRKLVALGHYRDSTVPRAAVADELTVVADEFASLQTEFKRLWLAEDRDNDGFRELVRRFEYTIGPCREKAAALRAAK